ncbi:hypothetical protein Q8W37_04875 [Shimia thalassica]|uniref:Lipoprotein n=1 Tax=Shimia thalassica TaxID=1715693 RepID=A0A0P1ICU0_9RHOB|nr:hypothetical protein [Shimia thalassica]MBU2943662.1 hypothetical protein [Shimia thalassica]MDO6478524.1 hypothetical protein [Shimia thalassica]MDO6484741.1 hypothetical protein [Shimia thalassica]MDO6501733.1 hypothetical protein [Shimia thalassica]MDO6521627.1 hypothetical protein [Shimia thalassica]
MKRAFFVFGILGVLAACDPTAPTTVRPGYEAGGMCNGGAHCGGGR